MWAGMVTSKCVCRIYIGAPAAVMAMVLLIAASVEKFLVFGGCGAIYPSMKIYNIVMPTWGIRGDGLVRGILKT